MDAPPIEQDKNLINVKSKRKRFLFKKAIELSQLCNVQVLIIVQDLKQDRMTMYGSGSKAQGTMYTIEDAVAKLDSYKNTSNRATKLFSDDDYKALDTSEYWQKHQQKKKEKKQ